MTTLKEALLRVPDHRGRSGRMYRLDSLILLVIAGFMCGRNSLAGVARFAKGLTREQREALGLLWFKVPCHATLCICFHGMDVEALESLLCCVIMGQRKDNEPLHLAVDGKTLKGSSTKDMPKGAHLLACFSEQLKGVVKQRRTKVGADEVTAAIELLKSLPLKGTVVTGDAMFTHRHFCETIVTRGGDYVLPLKDNQRSLKRGALKALEKKRQDA
jgi:hypothetical protein